MNNTLEQHSEDAALLALINTTPALQSLLYDIDLLHHNPREALTKYLASCEKRVNWDGVDKEACIKYAISLLGAM